MNRKFRSLLQTFLMLACALTLSLTGLDLAAQAEDNGGESCTVQSSHASLQQKRRRVRRRARTARKPVRESVDTTTVTPPVDVSLKGTPDVIPSDNPPLVDPNPPAPPAGGTATRPPLPRRPISGGVLNGKAISLPRPVYPAIAKAARASGTVVVQVTIDESGDVISARAVSGHPLLQQSAVQAARQARFPPTMLSGQPVKVTGTISYNFVL